MVALALFLLTPVLLLPGMLLLERLERYATAPDAGADHIEREPEVADGGLRTAEGPDDAVILTRRRNGRGRAITHLRAAVGGGRMPRRIAADASSDGRR